MTYQLFSGTGTTGTAAKPTRLIELTSGINRSVSTGSALILATIRATSAGHGVTVNSTTGEITLPGGFDYYVQASIEIDRNANTESFRIAFTDSGGTEITAADGGFDCVYEWHSSSTTTNVPNFTLSAVYASASPLSSIFLKCMSMTAGSVMTTNTSIIIVQVAKS
jgi:hypothetical protein